MTTAGIIGGIGPESTVDYYRRILAEWAMLEPGTAPSLVINSIDVRRALSLAQHDLPGLIENLMPELQRLAGAGADFAALSANTPHIVFDALVQRTSIPLLSIVEVAAREASRLGLERLGLLGTRFTMEAPFYREVFGRRGLTVVVPPEPDLTWVHDHYIGELLVGEFHPRTRAGMEALVARLRDSQQIDGVILGGTELPLLLQSSSVAGLPALDTPGLHVSAIVARLRGGPDTVTS
ncbi:MAG: aspartate/glutamate racemase superfamily protein [Gemmatimonadetes bacterium]|nr:aspartate/glutamate racemase superfamily protein [Gemmatimonadota bacterium]